MRQALTRVENFTSAFIGAFEVSTPKSGTLPAPRPPIPACIQGKIRLKKRLRGQWQLTKDPALKAEVKRLKISVTLQLQ